MRLILGYPSDIFCKIGYGGLTLLNPTYTSLSFSQRRKTAKATVFNSNFVHDVASTVATEPDFTKDELQRFFQNAGLLLWA